MTPLRLRDDAVACVKHARVLDRLGHREEAFRLRQVAADLVETAEELEVLAAVAPSLRVMRKVGA